MFLVSNVLLNAFNTLPGSWILPSKQTLGRTSGLRRKYFAPEVAILASIFHKVKKKIHACTSKGKATSATATCDCNRYYFKF